MFQFIANAHGNGTIGQLAGHTSLPYLAATLVTEDTTVVFAVGNSGLEEIFRIHSDEKRGVADLDFHPSLPLLGIAGPGRMIEIWDIATKQQVAAFGGPNSPFSPNVAVVPSDDPDGQAEPEVGHQNLRFANLGRHLVASSTFHRQTNVYDTAKGAIVAAHWTANGPLALSPSGRLLLLPRNDQVGSSLRFVGIDDGTYSPLGIELGVPYVSFIAFSDQGDAVYILDSTASIEIVCLDFPSLSQRWRVSEGYDPPVPDPRFEEEPWLYYDYPRLLAGRVCVSAFWVSSADRVMYVPSPPKGLVAIDIDRGKTQGFIELMGGSFTAITCVSDRYLVVGGMDGALSLFRLAAPLSPSPRRQDLTEAFLKKWPVVAPFTPWFDLTRISVGSA